MTKTICLILLMAMLWQNTFAQIRYPKTKTTNQTDTSFGQVLHDPYRWLEDYKSPDVMQWVKEQQSLTDSMLLNLNGTDSLITMLDNYNKQGTWWRTPVYETANKIFFAKRNRAQLNITLYYKSKKDTTEHLIFDNWKVHDGIRYNLLRLEFSPGGKYFIAALDKNGEEYPFVKVFNTQTNQWLQDSIPHCYESVGLQWLPDESGFTYCYSLAEDRNDTAAFDKDVFKIHYLNTSFTKDKLFLDYKIGNKVEQLQRGFFADVFIKENCDKLFIQPNQGFEYDYSNVFIRPVSTIDNTQQTWKQLFSKKDSVYHFRNFSVVTNTGYYYISAKGKGFRSLRKAGLSNPDFANSKIILKEDKEWQLANITETKSFILAQYAKYGFLYKTLFIDKKTDKVVTLKSLHNYDNRYQVVPMNKQTDECFFSNFPANRPRQSFVLSIKKDVLTEDAFWAVQDQTLLDNYQDIISEIVDAPSYDGALVPMVITRSKKTKLDGNAVCIIGGYGCYGDNEVYYCRYEPLYSLLMQQGIIFADALVRGGGAKGEEWHLAGMKENKPNTWKDFIACAEYLIKNKYTHPSKMACSGGSCGGVLIGRAITERPDLFRAANITSGSLNTARNIAYANGVNSAGEYGSPFVKKEFEALIEMDAVTHVKPNTKYPATYITTGINDTRVAPWMPYKFAATLQANNTSGFPVLLHTDLDGGHFGDTNAKSMLEQYKNYFKHDLFLLWQCGHPNFQKK